MQTSKSPALFLALLSLALYAMPPCHHPSGGGTPLVSETNQPSSGPIIVRYCQDNRPLGAGCEWHYCYYTDTAKTFACLLPSSLQVLWKFGPDALQHAPVPHTLKTVLLGLLLLMAPVAQAREMARSPLRATKARMLTQADTIYMPVAPTPAVPTEPVVSPPCDPSTLKLEPEYTLVEKPQLHQGGECVYMWPRVIP